MITKFVFVHISKLQKFWHDQLPPVQFGLKTVLKLLHSAKPINYGAIEQPPNRCTTTCLIHPNQAHTSSISTGLWIHVSPNLVFQAYSLVSHADKSIPTYKGKVDFLSHFHMITIGHRPLRRVRVSLLVQERVCQLVGQGSFHHIKPSITDCSSTFLRVNFLTPLQVRGQGSNQIWRRQVHGHWSAQSTWPSKAGQVCQRRVEARPASCWPWSVCWVRRACSARIKSALVGGI